MLATHFSWVPGAWQAELALKQQSWSGSHASRFTELKDEFHNSVQPIGDLPTSNEAQLSAVQVDWARVHTLPASDALTDKLASLLACKSVGDSYVFDTLNEPSRRGAIVPHLMQRARFRHKATQKATELISDQTALNRLQSLLGEWAGLPMPTSVQPQAQAQPTPQPTPQPQPAVGEALEFVRVTGANARAIYFKAETQPRADNALLEDFGPPDVAPRRKLHRALEFVSLTTAETGEEPYWPVGEPVPTLDQIQMPAALDGYTIAATPAVARFLAALFVEPVKFCLTQQMARSIYMKAIEMRGADFCNSPETGWGGLTNEHRPDKIRKAIELCRIDLRSMRIEFFGCVGYVVTCPAEQCDELFNFHRSLLRADA